jgi:glucose-1-phosphate cytidylyltransferase
MKVVILCGGLGTRIRDASDHLPKPMLPIGGRPIVWHIMNGYAAFGFTEFVLCLGYRGWVIKEFFLNYRAMLSDVTVRLGEQPQVQFHEPAEEQDWSVTLADTGEETQTGARVARIRKFVEDDDLFLMTYGDGVANVDVGRLVAFHRAHGKIATVTAVRPPSRFGELTTEGRIVRAFNEKSQVAGGLINGGFLVFDAKRVWPYLSGDDSLVLEREPLQGLASDGELVAFEHAGFWQPMDTLREYQLLNDLWNSGARPWVHRAAEEPSAGV